MFYCNVSTIVFVIVPSHINQFHIGVAIVERIVIHDAGIVGTTWPEHAVTNSSFPIHGNLSKQVHLNVHDHTITMTNNRILSRKDFQSPFNGHSEHYWTTFSPHTKIYSLNIHPHLGIHNPSIDLHRVERLHLPGAIWAVLRNRAVAHPVWWRKTGGPLELIFSEGNRWLTWLNRLNPG